MTIERFETLIFGINPGRLRWSPYSSDISVHYENDHHECEGIDPSRDCLLHDYPSCECSQTKEFVTAARNSKYGELKLFTLVDTNSLTVTLFRAIRPPVAMLLCGSEGGMERGLLCSYVHMIGSLRRFIGRPFYGCRLSCSRRCPEWIEFAWG